MFRDKDTIAAVVAQILLFRFNNKYNKYILPFSYEEKNVCFISFY